MTDDLSSGSFETELSQIDSLPIEEQISALARIVEVLETQLR